MAQQQRPKPKPPLELAWAARKRISADRHELIAIRLRREADTYEQRFLAEKAQSKKRSA